MNKQRKMCRIIIKTRKWRHVNRLRVFFIDSTDTRIRLPWRTTSNGVSRRFQAEFALLSRSWFWHTTSSLLLSRTCWAHHMLPIPIRSYLIHKTRFFKYQRTNYRFTQWLLLQTKRFKTIWMPTLVVFTCKKHSTLRRIRRIWLTSPPSDALPAALKCIVHLLMSLISRVVKKPSFKPKVSPIFNT